MTAVADATIKVFDIEDAVTLHFEVVDKNGNLANPPSISGWYSKPGQTGRTVIVFTNVAAGIYEADVIPAVGEDGDWWWRVETAGNGGNIKAQAGERTFHVRKQQVKA